jgi:hypothetical protein
MLAWESIWHIGIAVPDLDKGKKELGDVFGLTEPEPGHQGGACGGVRGRQLLPE